MVLLEHLLMVSGVWLEHLLVHQLLFLVLVVHLLLLHVHLVLLDQLILELLLEALVVLKDEALILLHVLR